MFVRTVTHHFSSVIITCAEVVGYAALMILWKRNIRDNAPLILPLCLIR